MPDVERSAPPKVPLRDRVEVLDTRTGETGLKVVNKTPSSSIIDLDVQGRRTEGETEATAHGKDTVTASRGFAGFLNRARQEIALLPTNPKLIMKLGLGIGAAEVGIAFALKKMFGVDLHNPFSDQAANAVNTPPDVIPTPSPDVTPTPDPTSPGLPIGVQPPGGEPTILGVEETTPTGTNIGVLPPQPDHPDYKGGSS